MSDTTTTDTAMNDNSTKPELPAQKSAPADSTAGNWISAVLLLGILFHLVYLTKDLGMRVDLTEEGLYSLSNSTQTVLDRLEDNLVIEAYFSQKLPGYLKTERNKLINLLDEYEQMGGGKLKVLYYDPLEDDRIKERADNLGIREFDMQNTEGYSISVQKVYQGLRIRYGGDRQKTMPVVVRSDVLETQLTPKIRELVLDDKPKVALLSRQFRPAGMFRQQGQQEPGFQLIERSIRDRYEVVSLNLNDGKLLPDDLDVLVLLQPLNLTDWEKYCIDQHVMKGGNLIVFNELADYSADQFNSFMRKQGQPDAPGSKLKWKAQLAKYGVEIGEELVADWATRHTAYLVDRMSGMPVLRQAPMPFWFQARDIEWKERNPTPNEVNDTLWSSFQRGISQENPVLRETRSLDFFWASGASLADELPADVTGEVLVRTSPVITTETPMQSSNPLQEGFIQQRAEQVNTATRRQLDLMTMVQGKFSSAFQDQEIPERPGQTPDRNGGLQETPSTEPKTQESSEPGSSEPGSTEPEPKQEPKPAGADPEPDSNPAQGEPGAKPARPEVQIPGEGEQSPQPRTDIMGPQIPGPAGGAQPQPEADPLPEKITKSTTESKILVVGDASLVRDDFLRGLSQFGPRSEAGAQFFNNILDWFALDNDLLELRNRRSVDRSMSFGERDIENKETLAEFKDRVSSTKNFVLILNTLLPVLVLVLFGVIVWFQRTSQKNRFLDQVERQG